METYFVRITLHKAGITYCSLLSHLLSNPTSYPEWMICREEIGSFNEHVHFYVKLIGLKKPAFVERLAKLSTTNSFKGNRSYSIKTCEPEDLPMYAYMVKQGNYEVHNISDELLKRAHEHDIKVKQEIKDRKRNLTQKLMDSLPTDIVDQPAEDIELYVCNAVIDYFVETDKPFTSHKVLGYVNLLVCKIKKGHSQSLAKQFFRYS